jgi:hypothetical protein
LASFWIRLPLAGFTDNTGRTINAGAGRPCSAPRERFLAKFNGKPRRARAAFDAKQQKLNEMVDKKLSICRC